MSTLNRLDRLIQHRDIFIGFMNYREAWQKLEEEREELGLDEKYTTYNSFRKAKSNYMDMKFV